VILGGGFAGVTTALELAKRCAGVLPVHITLMSDQNFFLFTPMLAEAATGAVESRHILYPIRPLCGTRGIEFGEMWVDAIDVEHRRILARHRRSAAIQPILRRVLDQRIAAYTDILHQRARDLDHRLRPNPRCWRPNGGRPGRGFPGGGLPGRAGGGPAAVYLHSLAAAVLALGAGLLLARRITRPLAQLTTLARRVVEGDLSGRARIAARDEIGMLGNGFYLMIDRLGVSHRSMVNVLVRALEARDGDPGSLSRLAKAARAVGDDLALSPAQWEALELGALLHDIGEIRTPEAILRKPGPLTDAERELVRQHATSGVDILESVPLLTPALDVVGAHHERYDGAGYPNRLSAEAIPLTARVFAVVDALFAMTHDRPYRSALPLEEALAEIRREAGKQFDPRVAEVALRIPAERWVEMLEWRTTLQPTPVG